MTLHHVETTQDLSSAFNAAADGDVIELAPGSYGWAPLMNRDFDTGIVVRSADPNDPAVFTRPLLLQDVRNVVVQDIDVQGTTLAKSKSMAQLFLLRVDGVELRNVTVAGHIPTSADGVDPDGPEAARLKPLVGFGYETGIRVHESRDVRIVDSATSDAGTGLYIGKSTQVTVQNTTFTGLREGIQFFETSDLTINGNDFRDFKPWLASYRDPDYDTRVHDHADMIQYWGVNSSVGVHRITITDNHFEMPAGSDTQTIFGNLSGAASTVTATDFTVTGNTILNGHPNAIRLGNVDGGLIADNVLLPNGPSVSRYWAPTIELRGSTDIEVRDNVFVAWQNGFILKWTDAALAAAGITLTDNTLLSDDPASPLYWRDWWRAQVRDDADPDSPSAPVLTLDGVDYPLVDHHAARQGVASHTLSDDGTAITLTDNGWKALLGDFQITADTVLSFTFAADTIGEIHGIGFANVDDVVDETFFQLAGTQDWGLQGADWAYQPGSGTVDVAIRVGEHFTGSFDRLVLAMDDDALVGADSTYGAITLQDIPLQDVVPGLAPLQIDGPDYPLVDHHADRQGVASHTLSDDGTAITLTDNGWKALLGDFRITADTVLSFTFAADTIGEIHGIGFANVDDVVDETFFQLAGTQDWGLQGADWAYQPGSGTVDVAIRVGEHFTGSFDRLVLAMDDDALVGADSTYGAITLQDIPLQDVVPGLATPPAPQVNPMDIAEDMAPLTTFDTFDFI